MASTSTRTPSPEAAASSQHAPRMPPSVASCMAVTPIAAPIRPSGSTLTRCPNARASLSSCSESTARSSSAWSRARIAVPSGAANLLITSASPHCAPRVLTMFSSLVRPITVVETTMRVTASVISVCPPTMSSPCARASSEASRITCSICSMPAWGGASSVMSTPTGSAPALATSLSDTCTASWPTRLSAAVMGSVDSTQASSPNRMAAQSSPTAAPTSTSGFWGLMLDRMTFSSSSFVSFPCRICSPHASALPDAICKNVASSMTGMPRLRALSSLLPAFSPAST